MNRVKEFVLKDTFFKLIMGIGFILLLIQMNQVVLYADDFSLGFIAKSTNLFQYFIDHYNTWGGGYTGCIVMFFLQIGFKYWKILNTFLIFLMVLFGTKMITHDSDKNKGIIATILWLSFFSLDIYVSKECIYWLDGSMAYVLSTFQMFIFIYLIYSKLIMNKDIKKYDYVLLPFCGLFSGWSSAQTGINSLAIVIMISILWKIKNKEKIKKIILFSIICCFIGCLIFYLSPGNMNRMQEFEEYASLNVGQKILYRVEGVYGLLFDFEKYQMFQMPFYTFLLIGLISTVGIQLAKKEKNKKVKDIITALSAVMLMFLAIIIAMKLNIPGIDIIKEKLYTFKNLYQLNNQGALFFISFVPYIITSIIMTITIGISIYISKKQNNLIVVVSILAAFLTQGIMVMAPYSPLRTTLTPILFFWIGIAYLISVAIEKKIFVIMPFVIALGITNINFGILLLILYIGIKSLKLDNLKVSEEIYAILIFLVIISMSNWYAVYCGYKINRDIYSENINRIEVFIKEHPTWEEQEKLELHLLLPSDEKYGFTAMTGIDWVDNAIKQYFNINDNVKLIGE